MPERPSVLLDDDGDLWIDLKGTGDYAYLSPYAALGPAKSREELMDDNPYLSAAEWTHA